MFTKDKPVEDKTMQSVQDVKTAVEDVKAHDSRPHLNIVWIGHVDCGKSTLSGQILLLTGQVDERTIKKYEKEAAEKSRGSWYIAFIMDTNEEERAKGKTIEVGRANFATSKKRYTLLDAPGHKNYVPNMIGGASQADVGILVISARAGEFEAGFNGGQTREHVLLAKTLGIDHLIVFINKMDDETVKWGKGRYDKIVSELTPFLKSNGYRTENVFFCAGSGYTGANIKDRVSSSIVPWYDGKSLFDIMDNLPAISGNAKDPLRMPLIATYKDMGLVHAVGKLESGCVTKGQKLLLQPTHKTVEVVGILIVEKEVNFAIAGENLTLKLKGVEEDEIRVGHVLSSIINPIKCGIEFEAQIQTMELPVGTLVTAGYGSILHTHTLSIECKIEQLLADQKSDQKSTANAKRRPKFLKSKAVGTVIISVSEPIAIETFDTCRRLGRLTLRDSGITIAVGKITKVRETDKPHIKQN